MLVFIGKPYALPQLRLTDKFFELVLVDWFLDHGFCRKVSRACSLFLVNSQNSSSNP